MCYRWLSKCFNCTIVRCSQGPVWTHVAWPAVAPPSPVTRVCSRKQSKVQLLAVLCSGGASSAVLGARWVSHSRCRGQARSQQPRLSSAQLVTSARPGHTCSTHHAVTWTTAQLRNSTQHHNFTTSQHAASWTYPWTAPSLTPSSSSSHTTDRTWTSCCSIKCTSPWFPVSSSNIFTLVQFYSDTPNIFSRQ